MTILIIEDNFEYYVPVFDEYKMNHKDNKRNVMTHNAQYIRLKYTYIYENSRCCYFFPFFKGKTFLNRIFNILNIWIINSSITIVLNWSLLLKWNEMNFNLNNSLINSLNLKFCKTTYVYTIST